MTDESQTSTPSPRAWAQYDDHSVLLCVQTRPDGPIGPIRLSPDEVLGLVTGLATAVDAFNAHRGLVAATEDAFRDAPPDERT